MVSFNMIIAAVAAVAGSLPVVLGGTLVEATAAADIVEFTSVAERGLDTRHSNTKDPYVRHWLAPRIDRCER
ncbi:hypothetical protein B0T26DRAFT_80863 [Lasiosphaeria miniovina]|uniref:Secreted protein n=1 Tax=Lasiosphaeria miniovina TaxID=1954250 RepID=A0AA40ECB7_9PEZI|nr:uncharacterized protein B0T26DRAFT_80863 [Lasiosphaeria miniovina]KAK0734750.1 hypothetical protein B0T26DRAFT_80863 [Lasiosphaeria miniovina]